jgi:hypothetical protein
MFLCFQGSHLLEKNADEANNNADTTRQDDTLANDKSQVIDAD